MRRILTFIVVTVIAAPGVASGAGRPNVLFCFADDWGRYASCYADVDGRPTPNQIVRTPNIDRAAARGVLFKNAFVNAPSCTPCRSALLTGRYFFNTGRAAILQGAVWDETIPAFPLLLNDAGYHIGKTAKVWSPGTPADAPFGGQKFAFQSAGMAFNQFSQQATKYISQGDTPAEAKARLLALTGKNFDGFLAARGDNEPFFYWYGPTNPHRQWVKGSGRALWDVDPDALKGKLPGNLPDVPEVREDFADYLGEVQAFDAAVGVLVERLTEAGELDNTLIVISGDHGAPGFPGGKCNLYDFGVGVGLIAAGPGVPGGRVVDDFVNLMDLAPTFLDLAGVPIPQGVTGKSLADVLRSDRSGQVDPDRTWVITGRERHVAAARAGNLPYPQRALRTKDFLYVRNYAPDRFPMGDPKAVTADSAPEPAALESNTFAAFPDMDAGPTKAWLVAHRNDPEWKWHYDYAFAKRPAEELYDLRTDPDQLKNVAADPAYAAARTDLAVKLTARLKAVGDPRVADADCRFEHPPFTDPIPPRRPKAK